MEIVISQYLLEVTGVCTMINTLPWMRLPRKEGRGRSTRVSGLSAGTPSTERSGWRGNTAKGYQERMGTRVWCQRLLRSQDSTERCPWGELVLAEWWR